MPLTVEAIYEDGVLKPMQPLPLKEHEAVRITVHSRRNWVERTAGIMGFKGSAAEADYFALDPELDPTGGLMTFADFLKGDTLFLDANTLIYHFEPHPTLGPPCTQLLLRIEQQELTGFTSTHILTEVAHRLMMIEAARLPTVGGTKVKKYLQQKPALVQQLTQFRTALEEVVQSNLRLLSISPAHVVEAAKISQQTGLLSNDALIVAVMQPNGLTNLASADTDFDRVPGITRYGPV